MSMPLFLKKDDGTKASMDKRSRCQEPELAIPKVKTRHGGLDMFKAGRIGNPHLRGPK